MANLKIKDLLNFFRLTKQAASGMHTDNPISLQPEGTVRNAWGVSNGNSDEEGGGYYNMQGQEVCAQLPAGADIRGQHFLEERDRMVVFLNIGGKSEIGWWSTQDCEYKKIIDDGDIEGCTLDFGTDEWIPIVSKNMPNGTCNEIHLYWSNGGYYKTLNIDRPCIPIDCDKINLFNCKCLPTPKASTTKKGGYDLEGGAYQYFAQSEDEDRNTTNFFNISNPVYIGSKNNRAGELSEQAINVTIENLDPDYPYVNIGCIKTVGGVRTALLLAKLSYSPNGVTFFHRSKSQFLYQLEIEEVLTKNPGYIRGYDLFQHDRVLYLFNTKPIRELDMQSRIIDSVKAKIKVGRVPMRYAHLFSGNQRDAVYSYSINYNYCDGRKTRAFHIPCFGTMPTSGSGCFECDDDNFKNNAQPTKINGKPYDNLITKGQDEYTPFTETKLNNLNNSDFDVPDDDQFVPPDTSGEGNACACWAFQQAAIAGIGNRQAFAALYHVLKDICESGCVDGMGPNADGQIIVPRSSVDEEEGEDFVIDTTTMPTADDAETNPDKRFKKLDDIKLNDGDKPSNDDITNSSSQGSDGNNSNTTETVHSGSSDSGAQRTNSGPIQMDDCEPTVIYEDGDCCTIKEIIPCIDEEIEPLVYLSCERYPNEDRCCSPGKTYGKLAGERIRLFRMQSIKDQPHFVSYHDGVPTVEHRDNHEYNNSFARFLWPEFSGIPFPKPEELDVPLCPHNPFTINWELRNEVDNTVLASGVLFGTFEGETLGENMLFPNHGTNSPERVDRWINNNGSHRTNLTPNIPAYVFHSPDTAFNRLPLNADYMVNALTLTGRGWRHGLYAEGADPDSSYVGKKNRKGARASMNLNKWDLVSGDNIQCILAASYVPANSVLDKSDEFSRTLNNLNRESCVYLETTGDGVTRINMVDTSFSRDVETHQAALTGTAQYVSLNRFIPNAYGGITDNIYFPIWQGLAEHIQEDGTATVMVRAGDTFINYWSIKRTSYVSNHVAPHPRGIKPNFEHGGGITLPWPFKSMFRKLFNTISADCNCGTVPQGGNGLRDPRASNAINGSGTLDRYFPQVQTQLVSFPVESRVNLGFQGSGDDASTSTYRDLNGQTFDSSFDGGDGAYERSWMDRYFGTMCENPKWKCIIRTILNILFTYGVGAYLILKGLKILTDALTGTQVGFVITIMSIVAVGMGILLMVVGFIWIIAWANTDLDNRMIDSLLGITDCFPDKRPKRNGDGDAEMKDSRVQGFEDNHYEYNYDFSSINRIEPVLGLPAGFDPCHCPNETSYPFWHSNPQNPTSQRDAYKNFKTNGYFAIPTHHGKPQRMFNLGNSVYVQTTDARFQVMSGSVEMKADGANVYLETQGRFLKHAQLIQGFIPEGEGGTRDPNACMTTRWGDISVDVEARQIYLFNGSSYKPLGELGMNKFFDNFMDFNDKTAVRDEKKIGGVGYSLGVDNGKGLLFITKHDRKKTGEETSTGEDGSTITTPQYKNLNWTLTFDMEKESWLGWEYFHPLVYAWDRFKPFSLNEGKMWRHNKVGEFGTVYGKSVPMVLDFVIRDMQTQNSFAWHNSVIDSEFGQWDDLGIVPKDDIFFTEVGFYNTFQSSGLMPFVPKEDQDTTEQQAYNTQEVRVANIHRRRRFNKLVDKVKPEMKGHRVFSTWRDGMFTDFVENVLQPTKTNENIIDNYMVMRLVFEGPSNVRVLLKNVITRVNHEEL